MIYQWYIPIESYQVLIHKKTLPYDKGVFGILLFNAKTKTIYPQFS